MNERIDLYRKPTFDLVDEILDLREQRDELLDACKALLAEAIQTDEYLHPDWPELQAAVNLATNVIAAIEEGSSE